ncbi:hypothetical protein [Corynebacterium aquilae]|uniref:Uncharacterized protein n=1 Tax=Corynebacterium aquilae DSM 44791 TaxID=1431546 RepID=A0A1L7CHT9_9CORY|nr:hypothetical protein [Corynebacterium aquilae]APT85398.1 hypothetical protein CAQU_10440 [Corynebacterium aquilae DSM 44791]
MYSLTLLTTALTLFAVASATIVLVIELRRDATTLRAVVTSGACVVFPVVGLLAYIIFRAVETRKELEDGRANRPNT